MLIVDLLRHTSGLTYGFQQRSNVDAAYREKKIGEVEKVGTLQCMIEDLAKIPLEFSPGRLELFRCHRRHRLSRRPDQRPAVRTVLETPDIRSVRDDRHRLLRTRRQGASFRRLLLGRSARRHDLPRRATERRLTLQDDPATSSFLSPPSFISGGGGLCSRWPITSPSAARSEPRRTRRRQAARTEDAGADDVQSPARRIGSAGLVALAVFRGYLYGIGSASASPSP